MDGLTPQQIAIIQRAQRLKLTLQSEGWNDVLRISTMMQVEALKEIQAYKGTNDHDMAVLAYIYKTLSAHHDRLIATINAQIAEEKEILTGAPKEPATQNPIQYWGDHQVKPQCDVGDMQ